MRDVDLFVFWFFCFKKNSFIEIYSHTIPPNHLKCTMLLVYSEGSATITAI